MTVICWMVYVIINEKHLKEIGKLKTAADRSSRWADKNENTKIGFDPVKDHDRSISSRSFIGAKTKKMQARVKAYETRIDREIKEKEGLLQDIERVNELKIRPLRFHKEVLINAKDLSLKYDGTEQKLFEGLRFQVRRGERVILSGDNGCGKSSVLRAVLGLTKAFDYERSKEFLVSGELDERNQKKQEETAELLVSGELEVASGLVISYVSQDTSFLSGTLRDFCKERGLDESFHLYIWDEPLNYIDVFSRMQIEKLILAYRPTMLLVEHDVRFREKIATNVIRITKSD